MSEKEIGDLKLVRKLLVSYREKKFCGRVDIELEKELMELSEVFEYRDILYELQKCGHNIKPLEVPDEMFDPRPVPTPVEELRTMLQRVEREGTSLPEDKVERCWVKAIVVKKKVDAAIAYIDSCLQRQRPNGE